MPRPKRDTEIHQDVRAELPLYEASSPAIEITVHRGVVYLNGLLESYAQKWAIGRAVTRIVGVKDLHNYLHVRPPGTADRDDRRIERAANRALHWDVRVPEEIRAEVSNGGLRLSGAVERCWQREAAEEAVRNLIGLRDIVNEIALLPAAPPADLALQIEAAIRRRFGLASKVISVAATQSLVTLHGVVPTLALLADIEHVVWSIPGVNGVENHLLVADLVGHGRHSFGPVNA